MITKEEAIKYLGNFSIPPMTSNLPEAVTEHQNYIDTLRLSRQSLQNEINFIEELEELRAEIDEFMIVSFFDDNEIKFIRNCFDQRISKLKGESDNMEKIEKIAEYSNIEREVANDIWEIAKKSPEHGNALMDLLGLSTYETISKIATYKGEHLKYSENGLAVAKNNKEE